MHRYEMVGRGSHLREIKDKWQPQTGMIFLMKKMVMITSTDCTEMESCIMRRSLGKFN